MISTKVKIAVSLAAFNGEHYIARQLDSILNQIDVDVTVYVSVDLSTDNTLEIVQAYAKQDSRVVLLKYGKRYGSAASNFFRIIEDLDFLAFDFLALSDQDDIWLSNKLHCAVLELNTHQVDAYSSNILAFWPNGKQKFISKAQPQQIYDYMFESPGPGCTFVLTQKLALAIQAFLIKHQAICKDVALHDWFIYAFARSRGFKWLIDYESHMLYRQHGSNVVGANVGFKAKFQRFKKARNGWLFNQATLIAEILGYANQAPIEKIKCLSFKDRLWLILNVRQLRRRLLDQFAFAFLVLIYIKK